jgi:hypothetical protein
MLNLISQVLGGLVKQGALVRDVAARRSTLPPKRRASTTGPRSGSCRLPQSVGSGNSWRWADGSCHAESRCGRIGVRKPDVAVLDRYLASSGYRFPVVPCGSPGARSGEWFTKSPDPANRSGLLCWCLLVGSLGPHPGLLGRHLALGDALQVSALQDVRRCRR